MSFITWISDGRFHAGGAVDVTDVSVVDDGVVASGASTELSEVREKCCSTEVVDDDDVDDDDVVAGSASTEVVSKVIDTADEDKSSSGLVILRTGLYPTSRLSSSVSCICKKIVIGKKNSWRLRS